MTSRTKTAAATALCALLTSTAPLASQEQVELPGRDRDLEAELQDVFSVGTFDGEPWETFGDVGQVAFDGQGNLYVLDRQTSRMILFDRQGNFLRMWGQEGEGPGEWRNVARAAVFRDGTVALGDVGHGSIQLFDSEGAFLDAVSIRNGPMIRVGNLLADPRGGALFNGGGRTSMNISMEDGDGPPEFPEGRPIDRITLGDEPRREMFYEAWQAPAGDSRARDGVTVGGVSVSMFGERPIFDPGLHTAALPDGGLAVADSADYAVKILDDDGRVVRRITRAIRPVEVTERIKRDEVQRQVDQLEAGGGPRMRIVVDDGGGARELGQDRVREMMRERIMGRAFYRVVPVVGGLAAGWDGLLWLERGQVDPDEPGPVDLFSPEGEYVGTLDPDGPGIPDAFGPEGLVAYIERDEYDVARVVVRRLPATLR